MIRASWDIAAAMLPPKARRDPAKRKETYESF